MRFSAADGTLDYAYYMGGSQDDQATIVKAETDGYVYVAGDGFSNELTDNQSQDVFLVRYSHDGSSLNYFKHFGGSDPD